MLLHFLYSLTEQKLDRHTFVLCSSIFEDFLGENQVPKNLLGFLSSPLVAWQCSLGICLAFLFGSTIHGWRWSPLLSHHHKVFLHMTYRTLPPLSGQPLISSSNFPESKNTVVYLRVAAFSQMTHINDIIYLNIPFSPRNGPFICRMVLM